MNVKQQPVEFSQDPKVDAALNLSVKRKMSEENSPSHGQVVTKIQRKSMPVQKGPGQPLDLSLLPNEQTNSPIPFAQDNSIKKKQTQFSGQLDLCGQRFQMTRLVEETGEEVWKLTNVDDFLTAFRAILLGSTVLAGHR